MGQALYRKYRSKSLSEILGQEHITQTLEQALKTKRISHAYLFTGPRGVGKTSIARILAHEINGLPYEDDSMHMDIIEIDAASNRRIDEIRELRDKVYIAPTSAKYKVYIIDEVHMLTKEAFNALLKTLEEPPAHVVFMLATTDAHKLPDTIVSRTQRFSFRPVPADVVIKHLKDIAQKENISISDEALEMLAEHGEGSFRDSISLLDQASNQSSKVNVDDIQQLLGIPSKAAIAELYETMQQSTNPSALIQQLTSLYNQGFQAPAIAKRLAAIIRQTLIDEATSGNRQSMLELLSGLIEVPVAHDPSRYLEILMLGQLLEADPAAVKSNPEAVITTPAVEKSEPLKPKAKSDEGETKHEIRAQSKPPEIDQPAVVDTVPEPVKKSDAPFGEALWSSVLGALKQKYNTLYGVVRMAQPTFEEGKLTLTFAFAFHQKRINDPKNKKIIADIIEQLSGQNVEIECLHDSNLKSTPAEATAPTPAAASSATDISAITGIFGGGELTNI